MYPACNHRFPGALAPSVTKSLLVIERSYVLFSDRDRNVLPGFDHSLLIRSLSLLRSMDSSVTAFLNRPCVSLWVKKARGHYLPVERKLKFTLQLHFDNDRDEMAVRVMGEFLVGCK